MTKNDRSPRRVSSVFCVGLLATMLGACGDQNLFNSLADDNTTVAEIESAKIAIDDGNYTQAIATLQGLCGTGTSAPTCDAETASLLASAFAGRAGLNVFDLIANSGGVLSGTTTSSLSIFSTLLSAPNNDDKNDLHMAVDILANLSNPTANQSLQMAIYAMADAVVTVGVDLTNGFDSTTGQPNTRPSQGAIQTPTLVQVSNDLILAIDGVDAAGLENEDIENDIKDLQAQIDKNGNETVEASEMEAFLASP